MLELSYILGIVIFGLHWVKKSCQTPGKETTLLPERATMASLKLLSMDWFKGKSTGKPHI